VAAATAGSHVVLVRDVGLHEPSAEIRGDLLALARVAVEMDHCGAASESGGQSPHHRSART